MPGRGEIHLDRASRSTATTETTATTSRSTSQTKAMDRRVLGGEEDRRVGSGAIFPAPDRCRPRIFRVQGPQAPRRNRRGGRGARQGQRAIPCPCASRPRIPTVAGEFGRLRSADPGRGMCEEGSAKQSRPRPPRRGPSQLSASRLSKPIHGVRRPRGSKAPGANQEEDWIYGSQASICKALGFSGTRPNHIQILKDCNPISRWCPMQLERPGS